jgi:hypothetical protein
MKCVFLTCVLFSSVLKCKIMKRFDPSVGSLVVQKHFSFSSYLPMVITAKRQFRCRFELRGSNKFDPTEINLIVKCKKESFFEIFFLDRCNESMSWKNVRLKVISAFLGTFLKYCVNFKYFFPNILQFLLVYF